MKPTARETARAGAVVLFLLLIVFWGGWRCPILAYTGIPCPGCGMTRAARALLRLDFAAAWAQNPMIFLLPFPVLLAAYGRLRGRGVRWMLSALSPFAAVWLLYWLIIVVPAAL